MGIGPTLVRRFVEMHGGSVSAESGGLARGSPFTIRLPVGADVRPRGIPVGANGEPAAENGRKRVLVADDNVDGAESLSVLLAIGGHTTEVAHTGPDALAAVRRFRPEVVFLDIGLPGMNGDDVATRFRREPDLASAALVALTGWGGEDDRRRSKDAGSDRHPTKPVEADKVEGLLARLSPLGRGTAELDGMPSVTNS